MQPSDAGFAPDSIVDSTIFKYFMSDTMKPSTRDSFSSTVLDDNGRDSLILIYSTETISYS